MLKNRSLTRTGWVLLLMLCVATGVCQAATTYYVDANYSGGTHTGSATQPWHSLNDSGAWSAINSALGNGAVTVYFSARQPGSSSVQIDTNSINLGSRSDTSSNVLTLDGISQYNSGSAASPTWSANVTPVPCRVWDVSSTCVWFTGAKHAIQAGVPISGSDSPNNCTGNFVVQGFSFQATSGQTADITYIHDLVFQYNEGTRIATGSNGPGVYAGPGQHGPCHSGAARPGGTDSGPDNVTIQYNYIHATWGECIYIGASTSDPAGGSSTSSPGGCGSCQQTEAGPSGTNLACGNGESTPATCNTGANYVIKQNLIESCASWGGQGDGTDIKDGHPNLQIIENVYRTTKACTNCGTQSPGNDGQGPLLESGSLVDGNYVEATGHQGTPVYASWNNSTGRGDIVLRNNIYVNINSGIGSNTALHVWGPNIPGVAVWKSVEMYNNTVYSAGMNTGDSCIQVDSQSGGTGTFAGATIENNIIDTCGGNGLSAGSASVLTAHDYNLFNNVTNAPTNIGGTKSSCSGATLSSESHGVCGNPMFISTSTPYVDTNFQLQSASPAIGAAATIGSFNNDYFGNTRAVPWDLNAIAHNTSAGAPQPPSALIATVN